MFEIGWTKLLIVGVALIAIGPKELPGVLRNVGRWIGTIRRMKAEFQSQFEEALREAEMAPQEARRRTSTMQLAR